jgi:hypothetical protein
MVSQMTNNWTTLYYQTYNPCVILNEMLLLASNLSISRIGYNLSGTFISNTYPFLLRFINMIISIFFGQLMILILQLLYSLNFTKYIIQKEASLLTQI